MAGYTNLNVMKNMYWYLIPEASFLLLSAHRRKNGRRRERRRKKQFTARGPFVLTSGGFSGDLWHFASVYYIDDGDVVAVVSKATFFHLGPFLCYHIPNSTSAMLVV